MSDNYELLKNLNIEELEEEVSEMEASYVPHNPAYQEDIAPEMAKQILGDRFIDKVGVRWQLIMEPDTMTLTAWVPGEKEPTTFELDSSDEVMSYDDMQRQLTNPDAVRLDVLNTERVPVKFRNWTAITVLSFVLLMIVGFGIMGWLFSLK